MSVPWTVSATSLVRDILSKNRYMKNPQIWQAATFGERPILQAKTALDLNGRIRMKKVSNIREGRRQWVPPPVKPLPEHPFQSMRFFKSHVLRSLEAQQLIHLAVVRVSISTKQGLLDAEKAAARKFRRMCLEADRAKLPRPTAPPPPATTVKDFVWTLGPAPTEEDMREGRVNYAPMDEPMTLEEAAAKCDDAAWSYAERLEAHYHKARLVEEANIVERKAIRAAYYKEMRVEAKRQRDEDIAAGRGPLLRQEARRAAAIEAVSQYAQATGEDVSDWYEEIAKANFGDELPQSIPSTRPSQSKRVDGRVRLTPVPAVKAVKKYAGAKQF